MEEQQAETARSLVALQDKLQYERDHRRRAEQEIEQLRQAGVVERDERIRQLEEERDSALRRVTELEGLVGQTGVLSRHPNHTVQPRALHASLRWRNNNARHPDFLAAQRRERARIRSEKDIRWGERPTTMAA